MAQSIVNIYTLQRLFWEKKHLEKKSGLKIIILSFRIRLCATVLPNAFLIKDHFPGSQQISSTHFAGMSSVPWIQKMVCQALYLKLGSKGSSEKIISGYDGHCVLERKSTVRIDPSGLGARKNCCWNWWEIFMVALSSHWFYPTGLGFCLVEAKISSIMLTHFLPDI